MSMPPRSQAQRHALGLPAGSVRAILSLSSMSLLGLIVFMDKEGAVPTLYAYLWFMVFLIGASFFASHGKTIGVPGVHDKSPLGLPRGSIRFLLLVLFGAIIGWLYHTNHLMEEPPTIPKDLMWVMPCGFFLGWLVSLVVKSLCGGEEPFWFKDIEAWIAIVAAIMLVVDLMFQIFINPTLSEGNRVDLSAWEGALAGMVSFYFGARA